jgi:hypothetical protein
MGKPLQRLQYVSVREAPSSDGRLSSATLSKVLCDFRKFHHANTEQCVNYATVVSFHIVSSLSTNRPVISSAQAEIAT